MPIKEEDEIVFIKKVEILQKVLLKSEKIVYNVKGYWLILVEYRVKVDISNPFYCLFIISLLLCSILAGIETSAETGIFDERKYKINE